MKAAPFDYYAPSSIQALNNQKPDEQTIATAAAEVVKDIDPPADVHASVEYRRYVATNLLRHALTEAVQRAEGRVVGFGLATFIEPAPGGTDYMAMMGGVREPAIVKIEPSGHVTAYTAQVPHGQSHETTLAQIVASELGVPFEHVKVVHGDTQTGPFTLMGTGGSRAATMASGAALFATREVKKQVLQIAGAMLEASPDDKEVRSINSSRD